MARTKTIARKSTGSAAPRKQLATRAVRRGAFEQRARQVPKSSETSSSET